MNSQDELRSARVLAFFNRVDNPQDIVAHIHDDPLFGTRGVAPRISIGLARRILSWRNDLPRGRFGYVQQLREVWGLGPDTMHDILFSFHNPREEEFGGAIDRNIATATPTTVPVFYVATRDGLMRLSNDGEKSLFIPGFQRSAAVAGSEIFILGGSREASNLVIKGYDFQGNLTRTVPIPTEVAFLEFVPLPGERFACLDNHGDKIHFIDSSGTLLATTAMDIVENFHSQNVEGVVVGNKLVVSEDGSKRLLAFDLDTYAVAVFRDFGSHPSRGSGPSPTSTAGTI